MRHCLVFIATLLPATATAQSCPGRPDALGTARVVAIDAATTPRVGHKEFPDTLPLEPKELVLTFDDGPWPTTTPAILNALEAACVRATFFLLGRNVHAHPALARREIADGHTVGHHDRLQARGLVVFAADVRASDWNAQEPGDELKLLLGRIDKVGRGCTIHGRRPRTCCRPSSGR